MQNIQCEACKALEVRNYIWVHCRYLLVFICQYTWQNAVYTCMYLYLYEEDNYVPAVWTRVYMYVSVVAHRVHVYWPAPGAASLVSLPRIPTLHWPSSLLWTLVANWLLLDTSATSGDTDAALALGLVQLVWLVPSYMLHLVQVTQEAANQHCPSIACWTETKSPLLCKLVLVASCCSCCYIAKDTDATLALLELHCTEVKP